MTRRFTQWEWESGPEVLPRYGSGDAEYWFYRDPKKGDSVVLLGDDGSPYYLMNPLEVPSGSAEQVARRYGGIRYERLWVFQFGAVGTTNLLVWARSLEEGLEEAAGWLEEFAPGHFMDDEYMKERYDEARAELGPDADEDDVAQKAEADLTYTESGYLTSYEWWANEADGALEEAGTYASRALYAAAYYSYDLVSDSGETTELDEEELQKMFGHGGLGLSASDVEKIVALDEGERAVLPRLTIERVG